jgi:hypothetical protein
MDYFLSGVQLSQQVFPEPYITTNKKNLNIRELTMPLIDRVKLKFIKVLDPLNIIVVAEGQLFWQKLSTNNKVRYV